MKTRAKRSTLWIGKHKDRERIVCVGSVRAGFLLVVFHREDGRVVKYHRSAFTKDMLREVGSLQSNAAKVTENLVPVDVLMSVFFSEEQEKAVPSIRGHGQRSPEVYSGDLLILKTIGLWPMVLI